MDVGLLVLAAGAIAGLVLWRRGHKERAGYVCAAGLGVNAALLEHGWRQAVLAGMAVALVTVAVAEWVRERQRTPDG